MIIEQMNSIATSQPNNIEVHSCCTVFEAVLDEVVCS